MESTIKKESMIKTGTEILDLQIETVPTLVYPIFQKYGAISLAGSSDIGKSYLLLQLADAILNKDADFLGFKLNAEHNSVIYVSTEDDQFSLCPRLLNFSKDRSDKTVYNNLRVVFESNKLPEKLEGLLSKQKADLIIIDTFGDIISGDTNQLGKVRPFLQQFKELANRHKLLIIFNHHCGKRNDEKSPHKDNLLGSQGFESSMRAVFELKTDFKDKSLRHLCIVKGNNISHAFKHKSFELLFDYEKGFSNTGNRVEFEKLAKVDRHKTEAKNELKDKVLELRATGISYVKIAEQLTAEGNPISKSKVALLCKDAPANSKEKEIPAEITDETDVKTDSEIQVTEAPESPISGSEDKLAA